LIRTGNGQQGNTPGQQVKTYQHHWLVKIWSQAAQQADGLNSQREKLRKMAADFCSAEIGTGMRLLIKGWPEAGVKPSQAKAIPPRGTRTSWQLAPIVFW
jgi:hypothetical protein